MGVRESPAGVGLLAEEVEFGRVTLWADRWKHARNHKHRYANSPVLQYLSVPSLGLSTSMRGHSTQHKGPFARLHGNNQQMGLRRGLAARCRDGKDESFPARMVGPAPGDQTGSGPARPALEGAVLASIQLDQCCCLVPAIPCRRGGPGQAVNAAPLANTDAVLNTVARHQRVTRLRQ